MIMIGLEEALTFRTEIRALARELNQRIAGAAAAGLSIEVSLIEIATFGEAGPTSFVEVEIKVRPDQVVAGPEAHV